MMSPADLWKMHMAGGVIEPDTARVANIGTLESKDELGAYREEADRRGGPSRAEVSALLKREMLLSRRKRP